MGTRSLAALGIKSSHEPPPQPHRADVHLHRGHGDLLRAAVEEHARGAGQVLPEGVLRAVRRRHRSGVADVLRAVQMKLAIVAGEASGDLHASEVARELKSLDPSLETFGIGGDLLAAEGMRILHHAREMGIVGLFNVLRNYPMFRRIFTTRCAPLPRKSRTRSCSWTI